MKIKSNNHMKESLVIALLLIGSLTIQAQNAVSFNFSGGIENSYLKSLMERQVSNLLTAINRAETHNTSIDYSTIYIDDLAYQSIDAMWANVHMRTRDFYITENCLNVRTSRGSLSGYQVRNIAVVMVPINTDYDEDLNQEICIDFDKNGKITDFNLTLGINQYTKILSEGDSLKDLDKRLQILHWTEQFRNAYCQKDIVFMENVFSDDALIITGKKIKRVEGPKVEYNVMNKQKYLNNLRDKFGRYQYINVQFDDIEIVRHGVNPNIYGVTLVQDYNAIGYNKARNYADKGWLFLVWDFTDEFNPKIHVRTWQDMKDFSRDDVMDLEDIKGIPGI